LATDPRPSSSGAPANGSGGPSGGALRQLANALDLPFVLVGSMLIGAGLGYFLDRRLHSSPVFTLVLGGLGFAGGIYEVVRRLTGKRARGGQ
jgi:F0F1-type ATP synthase assembly protein I